MKFQGNAWNLGYVGCGSYTNFVLQNRTRTVLWQGWMSSAARVIPAMCWLPFPRIGGECVLADGEHKSVGWTSPGLVFTSPRVEKTTPGLVHRVACLRDPVPLRADYWMADVCILWCDLLVRSARHTLVPFHVHFTLIYVFNTLEKKVQTFITPFFTPDFHHISAWMIAAPMFRVCFKVRPYASAINSNSCGEVWVEALDFRHVWRLWGLPNPIIHIKKCWYSMGKASLWRFEAYLI